MAVVGCQDSEMSKPVAAEACIYCKVTQSVCYWGELVSYKPWRRPALCLMSVAVLLGVVACHWYLPVPAFWWLLTIPLGALGVLGMLVSVFGCSACVVRLWGDA